MEDFLNVFKAWDYTGEKSIDGKDEGEGEEETQQEVKYNDIEETSRKSIISF
jgi:hypothetical protein